MGFCKHSTGFGTPFWTNFSTQFDWGTPLAKHVIGITQPIEEELHQASVFGQGMDEYTTLESVSIFIRGAG